MLLSWKQVADLKGGRQWEEKQIEDEKEAIRWEEEKKPQNILPPQGDQQSKREILEILFRVRIKYKKTKNENCMDPK